MAESHRNKQAKRWRSNQPINEQRTDGERRQLKQPLTEDRHSAERHSADRRQRVLSRVRLGVDYLFFLLYGLLALRFVLALVGANKGAGFVEFIQSVTAPIYSPFEDIVTSPSLDGGVVDLPALIALFTYGLLHIAVR